MCNWGNFHTGHGLYISSYITDKELISQIYQSQSKPSDVFSGYQQTDFKVYKEAKDPE